MNDSNSVWTFGFANSELIVFFVLLIAAFLIGSIPWGVIISRLFYGKDIRETGSGNIGAMNALRSLGTKGAIAVLLLDATKGIIPVAVYLRFGFSAEPVTGLSGFVNSYHNFALASASLIAAAAILGHCFSPWLKFKGGKGVATSFGALFAISWPAGLVAVAAWVAGALLTTYSSVGSILAHIVAPFALWYFTQNIWAAAYGAFAALLILYTHRANIGRLRAGQEQGIPFLRRNGRGS